MSRIVSLLCAVVLLAAGCGGAARSVSTRRTALPRALAHRWAAQADAIAAAAGAGEGCRAKALAGSLRTEVIQTAGSVPARLRSPLLEGVNSLADRIVCVPAPQTVTEPATQPKPPEKPPKKPPPPGRHDHHQGHHGDGGGDG
jgi:hypothetical protein